MLRLFVSHELRSCFFLFVFKFFFNKDHIGELVSTAKTFSPILAAKLDRNIEETQ